MLRDFLWAAMWGCLAGAAGWLVVRLFFFLIFRG